MTQKDDKKQIDDTMLEWYNLTDEDIEKMLQEGDFVDGDIVLLEAKIRVLLEKNGFTTDEKSINMFLSKLKKTDVPYQV